MIKHKLLLIILAILLSIPISGFSQDEDKQNIGLWFTYRNRFKISPSFFYYDDISYRQTIVQDEWQRFTYSPAIVFNATNEIELYFGLGNHITLQDVINDTYELRVWQGARITWPSIKRFHFNHYFRTEERFIYDIADHFWSTGYRGRYRLSLKVPINNKAITDKTFYTGVNAEVYSNIGKSVPEKYVNQARFMATLGYRKNQKWFFELIYVIDHSKEAEEANFELNNQIIRFRIKNYISL